MFARHLTVPSNMVLCLSGVHSILTLFSFQRSSPSCDGLYILPNSQELVKNFFKKFFLRSRKKTYPVSFQGPLQCPVPDGLISISQLGRSVNYFFTENLRYTKKRAFFFVRSLFWVYQTNKFLCFLFCHLIYLIYIGSCQLSKDSFFFGISFGTFAGHFPVLVFCWLYA